MFTPRDAVGQAAVPVEILSEPAPYTDVLDAFDSDDPFDIRISWGYSANSESGTIQRELPTTGQDGRTQRNLIDVAEAERSIKRLTLDVEVGLFRDLMVFFQLPFVLEDERRLRVPAEARTDQVRRDAIDAALNEPLPVDGEASIFSLRDGIRSQLRDGVPYVGLGVAWSPFNQYRTPGMPTWTLRLGAEIGTGATMSPCVTPSDNGCPRGASRGTVRPELASRWSYRYRQFEPYLGVAYAREFIGAAKSTFKPAGDLDGMVDDLPPSELSLTSGVALVPWEHRGRFQRLTLDARATATHVSAGLDYSPLFDALGTSTSPYLMLPNSEQADGQGTEVPFTGLTNTAAHARLSGRLALIIQAARYVRFQVGLGLAYTTPHLLTGAALCNDAVGASSADPRAGTCSVGISNPSYRAVIDEPGKRFRLDGLFAVDISASASGQF